MLKTFSRSDPDIRAFLVHLGRAFVTEVTLTAAANTRLRCQNWYDVNVGTVFGPPGTGGRTIGSYLDRTGRIEAIWFPFTDVPWLKVWSLAPSKPLLSRQIDTPYAYTFANRVTEEMSRLLGEIAAGGGDKTPVFTKLAMSIVGSGLIVTGTWDVWGWSKNSLLYVEPTTLRIVEAGWAVLTSRANVQRVVSDFYSRYQQVLTAHQARGSYPVNGPIELRITGTDPLDGPLLSPARARRDHPEWDTVVWLDFATYPGTPGAAPSSVSWSSGSGRPTPGRMRPCVPSGPRAGPIRTAGHGGTPPRSTTACLPPSTSGAPPGTSSTPTTRRGCSPIRSSTPCCPESPPPGGARKFRAPLPKSPGTSVTPATSAGNNPLSGHREVGGNSLPDALNAFRNPPP